MSNPMKRLVAYAAIDPEERVLAGRVSGWLYALGGVTVLSFLLLPGLGEKQGGWILAIGGAAIVWGLFLALVLDWNRAPVWLIHVSNLAGFGVVAVVVASSGGISSPGWVYLFFVAMFAAYFYRPPIAAVYVAGCLITQALPLRDRKSVV